MYSVIRKPVVSDVVGPTVGTYSSRTDEFLFYCSRVSGGRIRVRMTYTDSVGVGLPDVE